MPKEAIVSARIEPILKIKTEDILHKVGFTTAEAIRIFFAQILLHGGLPFDPRIPNAATRKAMRDSDDRRNLKQFDSFNELVRDLED